MHTSNLVGILFVFGLVLPCSTNFDIPKKYDGDSCESMPCPEQYNTCIFQVTALCRLVRSHIGPVYVVVICA